MALKRSITSLTLTALLHAGLIAAVLFGMQRSLQSEKPPVSLPMTVQLSAPPVVPPPTTIPPPLAAAAASVVQPHQPVRQSVHAATRPITQARPATLQNTVAHAENHALPVAAPSTSTVATAKTAADNTAVDTPGTTEATPAAAPQPVAAKPAAPVKTGISIPADYLAGNRKPDYPVIDRKFGNEGTVVLHVKVLPDGTAGEILIKTPSGSDRMDQAAILAVKTWRFRPASSDGAPIADWWDVPIQFKL